MTKDTRPYALVEIELVGIIAWNCPRCAHRNTFMVERGHANLMTCKTPPESPKGSRAAVLLTPAGVACANCRAQFRAVPGVS